MKKIQKITGGNFHARQKWNEIIDAVNLLLNLKGDIFIGIDTSANGMTAKLNLNQLLPRIPGVSGSGTGSTIRKAYCTAAAGSGATIAAELDSIDSADDITVNCSIVGGTALNSAIPRLEDEDLIHVWNDDGTWRAIMTFQATAECT